MNTKNNLPSSITMAININQEALLQIAVSGVEDKLLERKDVLEQERKKLTLESAKLFEVYNKSVEVAIAPYQTAATVLAVAIGAEIGVPTKAVVSGGVETSSKNGEMSITPFVRILSADKKENTYLSYEKEVFPAPVEVVKASAAIDANKEALKDNFQTILSIKNNLNDMGRYERKAKAKLAEASLKEGGHSSFLEEFKESLLKGDSGLQKLLA